MDSTTLYIIIGAAVALIAVIVIFLIARRSKGGVVLTDDEKILLTKGKFGKYELKAFITRGHFSSSFEAHDTELDKQVVLRILNKELLYTENAIKQFKLKTKTLKYFSDNYPAKTLISNIENGEEIIDSEMRPYSATDFLNGVTLEKLLEKQTKLSPADAYEITHQLSQVISLLNLQRVYVNEISPKNVFLSLDKSKRLIATLTDLGIDYKELPLDEFRDAKKYYYADEVKKGEESDEKSDVYALAALLFRMLTGSDVSPENLEDAGFLNKTLHAALSQDKEARPNSVVEFVIGLGELEKTESSVKELNWDLILPRLAHKKIRYRDLKVEDKRKVAKLKRKRTSGFIFYTKYLFSITSLGLAKLWEWWFQPKKVAITLILILVALGIWAYFAFTKIHGEIVINVRELSAYMPPKKISGILVHLEAKDRITNALVPLEFSTIDESVEPQDSKILLKTNEDGIAVAKYSGRFTPENVVISYHVMTRTTKYAEQYIEKTVMDTSLVKDVHVRTIRLRPIVRGTVPIIASIKGLPLARGDKPPETFKLDVYLQDAEGNPTQNARLYLKDSENAQDSARLEYRGGSYVLTENPLRDEPYYLSYIANDSSKISIKLIIEPEGKTDFKFETDGGPAMISKGGDKPKPVEPLPVLDEEVALQYKFIVYDEAGDPMKNIRFYIQASDIKDDSDKEILVTNDAGEVLYPDKPIQSIDRFWQSIDEEKTGKDKKKNVKTKVKPVVNEENNNGTNTEENGSFHYKIWLRIPGEPYPRDETRNYIIWRRPSDPSETVFRIELNLQTMEIDFLK